ncbi:unnamed protein product [Toxocara canis]|uniref:Tubulin polyglutamylase TTLL4 n=1 Tax=Toxocara canis TaxID=6265 RepID=A0A183TXI4_TOXCA|nr:unnamed protein product [Toxocara canis]
MEFGYLSHVIVVFERLGYKVVKGEERNDIKFDVLWSHEYPFSRKELQPYLKQLKPYQKLNHIPGSGYYTSKVSLATADISEGIPKAFEIPRRKKEFLNYAKANPDLMWVKKNNEHRGIRIRKVDELDLNEESSFVQQFIANPLLIDGRKFDIGIYTVITSVLPLRVYVYEGDALLRFCSQDYQPFDAENVEKYVVGDNYTPVWEMPSLKKYYVDQQMTFRQTLNAYLRSIGRDPDIIWDSMKEIIAEVNFQIAANMSPNLSSGHFTQNRLLYEQVLVNLLSLVGIATHLHGQTFEMSL